MSRRALVLGLLCSILALGTASTASAQELPLSLLPPISLDTEVGPPLTPERGFRTLLTVDAPGAYDVNVVTDGSAVALRVSRTSGGKWGTATYYLARGVAQPERLRATFGKLGKISMRFRESRHRPWFGKRRDCRGKSRFVVKRGVFVGNLRFRGEDDYLTIRTHRVKGSILSVAPKCLPGNRGRARSSAALEDSFTGFVASDRDGVESTAFGALSIRERLVYLAQHEENRGKLGILHMAIVGDRGELDFNESITVGKFSPGGPFHGTGLYRAAPDGSTTWTGNLSIDFPGAPGFPLTGPAYETFLEAGF
ncbi:MAG TPA: hypothetical protein VI039_12250 [Solirubrobacterales bacterium]